MPTTLRARLEKRLANLAMRMPKRWLVRLAGGRSIAVDGFVLDEQVQFAIAIHARLGKRHTHELDLAGARRELEESAAVFAPKPRAMARVADATIDGPAGPIPIRIYEPRGLPAPSAALIFFHGGGFALGSLDSHDAPCRVLADDARVRVIAVDYRLAPEAKFPAAVDDALAAFRAIAEGAERFGIDPSRIAVGGDSAGGNLAAVVALETRKGARKPCFQLLIYPATDLTMGMPSHRTMGKGFFLEHETMLWFRDQYLPDGHDRRDPRASPLFWPDVAGAPPAFVMTAAFDPLRDEGDAYAKKLAEAGVRVTARCHPSLFHGFFSTAGGIDAARLALTEASAALREATKRR